MQFYSKCDSNIQSGLQPERREKTAQRLSLNPDVNCDMFFVSRPIKNDLVSGWDGLSQLSQIIVMFCC